MEPSLIRSDESLDELFRGKLKILQKRTGYRLSMDPVLLAHFAAPIGRGRVIDLGTGSGIIPLILSLRADAGELIGLEIHEDLTDMAQRSVKLNHMEGKVQILCGDYRKVKELFPAESFQHVLSNPPYHARSSGRPSLHAHSAVARHEITGSLKEAAEAARYLLGTKGRLWLTYPPSRLVNLLTLLRESGLEPKNLRMVHGRMDTPARMLLLEAARGAQEGLEILPPLILYKHGNVYTEELEMIYSMV
jgi:tRNA1Val (adenine37-N6)-methyltransferase